MIERTEETSRTARHFRGDAIRELFRAIITDEERTILTTGGEEFSDDPDDVLCEIIDRAHDADQPLIDPVNIADLVDLLFEAIEG